MSKFQKVIVVIAIVYFSIATLGKCSKDIDGAEDAANRYCEMVYEGNWPDYQQNYQEFCNGPKWNGK